MTTSKWKKKIYCIYTSEKSDEGDIKIGSLRASKSSTILMDLKGVISEDFQETRGSVWLCSQRLQHQHLNFLLWRRTKSTGQI